jgi:glycosyltransferase involved in cell wall biosynthesis
MYQNIKMAALNFLYTDSSVLYARDQLQQSVQIKQINDSKQLLVDVSVIIRADAGTGVQRLVRALLKQLQDNPPAGYEVRPVFASIRHNYRYAPESFSLEQVTKHQISFASKCVTVAEGDVFLGLDLATALLPKYQNQLEYWKRKGVKIHIVVYDLLPVLHPEWFHFKTTRNFYRWLRSLAIVADSVVCISKIVKADLSSWLVDKYAFPTNTLPINVIPMGCDIEESLPSKGLPKNAEELLKQFKTRPTVLMVGTLEPRKGHGQILDAFEHLWKTGIDVNLLIVGKRGWKTKKLQARLLNHVKFKKNLFWLSDVSDELLEIIYEACYGLILASEAEGFGLPLIEAMQHGKPVLARDLPVFREISGSGLNFFEINNSGSKDLAASISAWLSQDNSIGTFSESDGIKTWKNSAAFLLKTILGVQFGSSFLEESRLNIRPNEPEKLGGVG